MDASLRLQALANYLRESLWAVPALGIVLSVVAVEAMPRVDLALGAPPWFEVGRESARSLLSTIAQAMITVTGLVFSITMLVLQLANQQLSPRVMRHFLRDRNNQVVLALFIATFTYALLALRKIGPEEGDVPTLTVWVGFLLTIASVGAFVHYIDHMAQAVRPGTVIEGIARETREALDRLYPHGTREEAPKEAGLPPTEPDVVLCWERQPGIVTGVDDRKLEAIATEEQAVIALVPRVGDFLPHDAPFLRAWGPLSEEARERLPRTLIVSRERTMRQDAAFGFRQLVDIAERALSTGVNDPTTAVQAVDHLHDLLRRLATRHIPASHRADDQGRLVLVLPRPDWEDYVSLAVDEVRIYGMGSTQIQRRLRYLVEDVLSVAPAYRRPALLRQSTLLDAGLEEGLALEGDRETASQPSPQG